MASILIKDKVDHICIEVGIFLVEAKAVDIWAFNKLPRLLKSSLNPI